MKPFKPVAMLLLTLIIMITSVPSQIIYANTDLSPGSSTGNTVLTPDIINAGILTPDEANVLSAVGDPDGEETENYEITLNTESCTLYAGDQQKYQLTAVASPTATITWKSSNSNVASVNDQGQVSAHSAGNATITASANGVSAGCEVTVMPAELSLKSKATVYVKVPYKLTATPKPAAQITWKSSNTKIATVKNGTVTGKKTGKVTITASANGLSKKCSVTVKNPKVSLSTTTLALFKGSVYEMHASATPKTAIKWKSSKPSVASVDKNGVVIAKKAGTTKITATVGSAKASCTVTVLKNSYKLNITSRTLMTGSSLTIYIKNAPAGVTPYFSSDANGQSIRLSSKGNSCTVKGLKKGTATIFATFTTHQDGYLAIWSGTCTIEVIDTGISGQQFSLAKGTTKPLTIKEAGHNASIKSTNWQSSAPAVASVNTSGVVTARKIGTAKISADVIFTDGRTATYQCTVKVSDPKFKYSVVTSAAGVGTKLSIKNTNSYSQIKWSTSKKSVVSVGADGIITGRKKGSATIKATVDGKSIRCKVYVSNPKLKTQHSVISIGEHEAISVKGLLSKSKITYKSSNPAVASVSKKGVIKGKAYGKAIITVNADGKKFSYIADVAPVSAKNATRVGKSIMYSSSYSQARRMSNGYYDCSSLVFRAYGCDSGLLGGIPSWAPTAASMALHMAKTGKVLSYGYINVSRLRPGDLIFYGRSGNGRYLGIYHVSMYYGNGLRLEKPFCPYSNTGNIVMIARPIP